MRIGLGARLIWTVVLASVLPTAAATWISTREASDLLTDQLTLTLAARADGLVDGLDGLHGRYLGEAVDLSRLPSGRAACAGAPGADFAREVKAFVLEDPDVVAISLIGRDGRIAVSTSGELVGAERGGTSGWLQARAGHGDVDGVRVGTGRQGREPLITYSAPVAGGCAVTIDLRAEVVRRAVRAATGFAGPGSYAVVLDQHGMRIAHGLHDELAPPGAEPELSTWPAAPKGTGKGDPGPRDPERFWSETTQGHSLRLASQLALAPWTVYAVVPEEGITGPVSRLARAQVLAAGWIAAIAIVVGVMFANRLRQPLDRLAAAAVRLGEGDLDERVPYEGTDEIGRLAAVFNRMAAALADNRRALEDRVAERTQDLDAANRELRRKAEELLTANEEVRRADRMKTEFLANMSHELRTPLSSILGFADLLLSDGELGAQEREYVGDIRGAGAHLLTLITDLLDLAKIEAGRVTLARSEVEPGMLLHGVAEMCRAAAREADVRVVLRNEVSRAVRVDEGKTRQILINLVSNALKYAPAGSEVVVGARDLGDALELTVEDHGPGVPDSLKPRLFQPFEQAEDAMTKRHPGTGLGLAISRRLAEAHGGTIAVEEPVGGGARFRVILPG